MNIFRVTTTLCFLLFCLFSCSSVSVNQDYDTDYDFSKLKTFGFLPVPADAGIDQLSAKRIGDAVTSDLTAKGYSVSKEADFGIALHFGQETKTNIDSWGYGWGAGAWGGMGAGNVDVTQYEEGTLVIDFVDMKEKKMIWRGSGKGALADNPNVEERTKNVNEAVRNILEKFPPTPK